MLIRFHRFVLPAFTVLSVACGPSTDAESPTRPPLAEQWYRRAKASYRAGDFEDARDAVNHAVSAGPQDPDSRVLAARIALTQLDFTEALKLTEGLKKSGTASADVHAIRGRAHWYNGDTDAAADELEAMLEDPSVKDPWARDVAKLARRGSGRHPFSLEGGSVAVTPMLAGIERADFGPAHIVQIELEGSPVLAMVATGVSELMIDSNSRGEPAWVSLRVGAGGPAGTIEVRDVPALVQDLAPISRQIGVPIKALLGVNLLRHIHCTFDRRGEQFILRRRDPPSPPEGSRVPLSYLRGGGMTLRGVFSRDQKAETPLMVDSTRFFTLALTETTWKKAGVETRTLTPLPDAPSVRSGPVPIFRLGGFDLAQLTSISGAEMPDFSALEVDIGGVVGADLLSFFRVTLADEGRFAWLEVDPSRLAPEAKDQAPISPPPPPAASTSPAAAPAPIPRGKGPRR